MNSEVHCNVLLVITLYPLGTISLRRPESMLNYMQAYVYPSDNLFAMYKCHFAVFVKIYKWYEISLVDIIWTLKNKSQIETQSVNNETRVSL